MMAIDFSRNGGLKSVSMTWRAVAVRPSVTGLAAHFGRHLGPAPAAPAAPAAARALAASGHLSEAGAPAFASAHWSELELWQFIALVQVTYAAGAHTRSLLSST